jgi:hypothetical protein
MDFAGQTASGLKRHSECEKSSNGYTATTMESWPSQTSGSLDLALYLEASAQRRSTFTEHITQVGNEEGIIIITTNRRTLVFGSRMSGWE